MHSFESGLMPADRRLTSLGNLAERGKPVPRSALGIFLGDLDQLITKPLFWGSRQGPWSMIGLLPADRLVVSNTSFADPELGKLVPRPALSVVMGGQDWDMG